MLIDDEGWTQCGCGDCEPETGDMDEPYRFGAGDAEPCGFMWQPSYTKVLSRIPSMSQQAEFALKTIKYGAFGTEPFFEYPLDMLFEAIRPNLDISKKRSRAGRKGGKNADAESA